MRRRLSTFPQRRLYDYALDSMRHLFEALFYGLKKTAPVLELDSS
jgi:hypothetical protein